MSKIRIERSSEWNYKAREIGIYIDGEKVGTLKDGETQDYQVENGEHEIYAKIDWCRSRKIKLKINDTKTLELSGFRYGNWILPITLGVVLFFYLGNYALDMDLNFLIWIMVIGFLYPIYFISFGKTRYLKFTEKSNNQFKTE